MTDSKPKRGRKPKNAPDQSAPPHPVSVVPSADDPLQHTATANPQKSRRGRKPRYVYNTFENCDVQTLSDDENIIMKLDVSKEECDNDSFSTQDDPVDAYNNVTTSSYCDANFTNIECTNPHESKYEHDCEPQYNKLKVIELLKDFEEKNKNNEWPQSTSIHCYWCCQRFDNSPFGIPVKYVDERFHVYGCFCSLECAAAFNMNSKESMDEVWERYNLINLLSRRIGYKDIIKPAPNRLALKTFGGHLTIEEFRAYCNTSKLLNINFPPMMTMTQQIEEINDTDINSEFKYIPIDTDRINKYKEKIKIKRIKPLTDFKNTLDHAMNLKFGN